jgi:hypothetical protein
MDVITITENTQATRGDLKIGAGNIWEEEYVDATGAKKKGPTAGLWIYVRNDDSKNQTVRVHPGQILHVASFTLEVKSVTEDSVALGISP